MMVTRILRLVIGPILWNEARSQAGRLGVDEAIVDEFESRCRYEHRRSPRCEDQGQSR
jgi:hypothetical protein